MTGWSVRTGDWFGVFGPRVTVVVPPGARSRAAGLWELVDDGADLDVVIDALLAPGLRELPGFVLVAESDGPTTVVVRGTPRVRLTVGDEVVEVTADDATTWVERTVPGATGLRLDVDAGAAAESVDDTDGLVTAGLVRVRSAEWQVVEVPEPAGADHDGLTHAALEDTGLMPAQPGIPGQPPAPAVTARPVARLLFSSGADVAVDRAVLVGRAPEATRLAGPDEPVLVAVPSPQQEISSTHLEVRPGAGADHGSAVATDLGSTNGTLVRQPGLPPEDLRAGVAVQLIPGAVLDLGDGITIQVVDA